ncbi:hypothetical protein GQ42DRAFT_43634 [Ramicandelaber brevisporus]|nr:hypothetical protein GQ42DRAFT_43634 [Ramicandelaber brevisporus]
MSRFLPVPGATAAQSNMLADLQRQFTITPEKLREIVDDMAVEMKKGLVSDGEALPMIPSFVRGRPTGTEQGSYLALDFGGTNLRVCRVNLDGKGGITTDQQKFVIPEDVKHSNAKVLFDWVADCVSAFLPSEAMASSSVVSQRSHFLNCGFTFSFAVNQTAINEGVMMLWNKGFTADGVVGHDVVLLLDDAFKRKGVKVHVSALVNDTVGALLASAYTRPDSLMGVIFGTGTNAAYYEKMSNITKWNAAADPHYHPEDEMAINTEWGAYDCSKRVLPITMFDNRCDRETVNPGKQIFEKMISGLFLGEVCRNVILHLIDNLLLFKGFSSPELNKGYSFDTSYMSTIESDDTPDLHLVKHVLESVFSIPQATTLTERRIVQAVVNMLGNRAARLSGAALAAVLKMREDYVQSQEQVTIGIDGSLYEFYPGFDKGLIVTIQEALGTEIANKVNLTLAKDGSGVGAAIIAMIAGKGV